MDWILRREKIASWEAEEKIKELADDYMEDGMSEYEARAMAISDLREEYDWQSIDVTFNGRNGGIKNDTNKRRIKSST